MTDSSENSDVWRFDKTFPSVSASVAPFLDAIVAELEGRAWDPGDVFAIRLALDEAVKVAIAFQERHPDDTLIVVTGDHETGGMTMGTRSTISMP